MGYNKFMKKDGTVLLDLTGDTITPETLHQGVIAHNASGEPIEGSYQVPTGNYSITGNGTFDVSGYSTATVAVMATSESAIPTEISTEEEMTAILTAASPEDNGRIYKYVGPDGQYINGAYYKIEVEVDA